MAVTGTFSNRFKAEVFRKTMDLNNDSIIVILMDPAFVFDPDTHSTLADVAASQIATGNGYVQNAANIYLSAPVAQNNTLDQAELAWDDVMWTASGGSIASFGSAIIYDDTTADDVVIGCVNFGTTYNPPDGSVFAIKNLFMSQSQG